MAVTTTKTNKPLNPRGNDQSPKGYNRAALYSGKALDFDGVNDNITIPNSDSINITGDALTIAGYINTDGSAAWQGICYKDFGNGVGYQLFVDKANGTDSIAFGVHTGTFYRLYSNEVIENNKWYFVVATYDGVNQSIYINGVFDSNQAVTGNITDSSIYNLYIGRNNGGSERFNGEIGGFKIFNTALTAAQVADLYNNPEKIVPTGVSNDALKLWLPMQEGAGTTAYDGSGNGNHGTISGATYTHGIGAPVSQTAVIDWNKGTNKIYDSELYTNSVVFRGMTKNSTTEESPIGTFDAIKMTENGTNGNPALVMSASDNNTNVHTLKAYLKADAPTSIAFATTGSSNPGNINVTTEWQAFEVSQSSTSGLSVHIGGFTTIAQGSGIVLYVWHPQLQEASSAGPYVGTFGTSQPNDVLLLAGLTTGRDITGVNLFENVRKQGALNLDGNSWAEVHDNASLDITGEVTLECWIYFDSSGNKGLLSKWNGAPNQNYLLYKYTGGVQFYISSTGSNSSYISGAISTNGWHHVVGTDDGTTQKIYIDSVLKNNTSSLGSIFSNSSVVEIGRYNLDTNTQYPNDIAQPRIYNRALSAEEIQRNFTAGKNTYK